MTREELYAFMTAHRWAVQATVATSGAPQAAVIGFAATRDLELVFDTLIDPINAVRATPAKGALFNAQMLGEKLSGHPDGSHGVHNPFLYRALLLSSIADLEANYGGFLPAPPAAIQEKLRRAIRSGQLRVAPATEKMVMRTPTR